MGIDIVGKLTQAQVNYTIASVAVEYFMKWVEAKPITNISSTTIKKSSDKISFATMASRDRSQLITPSISIIRCSRFSTIKSE
jgi:hypothetical protein